jgi:hypothetical protein
MRGSLNRRKRGIWKTSTIGEKSQKRLLTNKAGETLIAPCKNRISTVYTETRLNLSRSNNDGGSLMMIFGTRSSKKIRERVVTRRNISSNAIVHHRHSCRSMEACDSLLCVGTPNNIDIVTKPKSRRSKPRRLISREEKSMPTVINDEFVDQCDDLIFDSDPIRDQRKTDKPAILTIDHCNQEGISEKSVDPRRLRGANPN